MPSLGTTVIEYEFDNPEGPPLFHISYRFFSDYEAIRVFEGVMGFI